MGKAKDIQFSNCVMGDKSIYAFMDMGGYPIRIDLQTKEVVMLVWKGISDAHAQVDSVIYSNHVIYVLELNGRRVIQYNIQEESIKFYDIHYEGNEWGNFACFTKMQQTIFIFPKQADCFYEIDLLTGRIVKKETGFQDVWFSCAFRNRNEVCLLEKDGNNMQIFDLHKETFKQYELEQKLENLVRVGVFGDRAYLLSRKGEIYFCRLADYSIEIIRKSGKVNEDLEWGNIAITQKNIWLLPALGNDICVIDRDTLVENVLVEYPEDFFYRDIKGWGKYYGCAEDEEKYYYAPRLANYMLEINKNTGKGEWVKIVASLQKDLLNMAWENNEVVKEGAYNLLDLHDFLDAICS